MIISIIQPCFIPWIGYFEQIAVADIFVYMDDVQYTKKDWRNNNQLKSPYGVKGVSFPVHKEPLGTRICDMRIANNLPWKNTLFNQIENWYGKAKFYDEVIEVIGPVINRDYELLVDFNHALNSAILDYLGIKTRIYFSSSIPSQAKNKTERIAEICRHFDNVDTLFDGKKARDFLDEKSLSSYGIDIIFQDYKHIPYPQLHGEFEPYMSIVDLLMNCGKDAVHYIVTSDVK